MRSLLFIWFCIPFLLQAQPVDVLQQSLKVEGHYADLALDPLGQLYLISEEGQLKKMDDAGITVAQFNEARRNGKLQAIDLSNPLKPLLFFRDLATLVVLDRNLNKRDKLEFRAYGMLQIAAVAAAYDNGYWVYDVQEAAIRKFSEQQRQIERVIDLRQQLISIPQFSWMIDQSQWLIAYDPSQGFFLFDHYGAFRKKIPFLGYQNVNVIYPWVIGRKNDQLTRFNVETLEEDSFSLPAYLKDATKIVIGQYHLAALFKDSVVRYTFKLKRTAVKL